MKNTIKKTLFASSFLLIALSITSCKNQTHDQPTPPNNSIGSYSYNDENYKLFSAGYSEDDAYVHFMFSSQNLVTDKVSDYFTLSLNKKLMEIGTFSTEDYNHNFDYIFVFETPYVFYSKYKKVTGRMAVTRNSATNFKFMFDLKLIDGKSFKFNYNGDLTQIKQ